MELKQQAEQNLRDIKQILDELKVVFWLDAGTLLGAYRDKDFCVGDEDDVDLCTWEGYLTVRPEITRMAQERGFELLHEWQLEICLGRGGSRVDIFFNGKNGTEAYRHLYAGTQILRYLVVPSRFYEVLVPYEFKGMQFLIPSPTEEYLELKYGDWKTPVHRGNYSFQMDKLLRETYV
jgi:hypothetical protein